MNGRIAHAAASAALLISTACGESGLAPSSSDPRVAAIAPGSGTTLGGTAVTITGANFGSTATLTIGGTAAGDVVFVNAGTLTATTPQHAAGSGDVVVRVGGRSGTLARGYTFVAPAAVTNQPPTITSISVRGASPRQPAHYASLNHPVTVSASVSDAESAIEQLTLAWSSDVGGSFAGSGASVSWTPPAGLSGTPRTATLTLLVTDRYPTTDSAGLPTTAEHRITRSSEVRVHDSVKEVGDLAVQFLLDFSRQLDPAVVMRNFTASCPGTADELSDVQENQRVFLITSYTVGPPSARADFTGSCSFRNRFGDACVLVPVEWHSTIRSNGRAIWTRGIDQVTAVFENDQWKLCASDYDETAASPVLPVGPRFKR